MKITIRTLSKQEYQFECEPTDTIQSLKEQIHEQLKHEVAWQTLIYSGQVLTNDRSIESCKILEKGFMVLMVKPPKAQPAPVAEKKVETPAAAQTPVQAVAQHTTPAAAQTPVQAPTQQAPEPPNDEVVTRMVEMGFPREDCLRALEAAWGNADRAAELLMMGAPLPPRGQGGMMVDGPMNPRNVQHGPGGSVDDDTSDEGEGNPFDILKNTPQFQQLRALAQHRPEMLEQVLQQLSPDLVQLITQNQEEFIRLLQDEPVAMPVAGARGGHAPVAPQNPQGMAGMMGMGQGAPAPAARGGIPPGAIQIRLTQEDEAVVNNLVDMTGCTKDQVVRAFALFEKDAEMTANYLLNHGHDDDAMQPGFGGFGGFGQ